MTHHPTPIYALLSEWHLLSPSQRLRVNHLIIDDETWTDARIADYIASHRNELAAEPGTDWIEDRSI